MFDLIALSDAIRAHGRVARLVIAGYEGSSPREVGAAMLVWADGQSGTVGGGAFEWQAIQRARAHLSEGGAARLRREALGPKLGQCCGGAVTLLTEVYDEAALDLIRDKAVIARPAGPESDLPHAQMPLQVRRLLSDARAKGITPAPVLLQGWMVEPVATPEREIWVWGAGHVGRALVSVLAPLPGMKLVWIDTAADRFPELIPDGVTPVWAARPEMLSEHAPVHAEHLIVTYSHALDLELCHRLLDRGFGWLGLIGSETKWARFRARLAALGHGGASISRITSPIGDTALGKHPQAIAVGVAVQLLKNKRKSETEIADDHRDENHGRAFATGRADQGLSGRRRE